MQSPLLAASPLNFDAEAVQRKASGAPFSRSTSAGSTSSRPPSRTEARGGLGDALRAPGAPGLAANRLPCPSGGFPGMVRHDGSAHKVHVSGAILATPGSPSSPASSEERFASWSASPSPFRSSYQDCLMGLGALAEAVGIAALPSDVEEDQELMEYSARYVIRGAIPPPPPLPPVLATFAPTMQPPVPPPHLSASQVYPHMQGNICAVWPRSPEKSPLTVGSTGHCDGNCKPCAFVNRRGCDKGTSCPFCHVCAAGETGRRRQLRRPA